MRGVSESPFTGTVYGVDPNNICADVAVDVGKVAFGYSSAAEGSMQNKMEILLCVQVKM